MTVTCLWDLPDTMPAEWETTPTVIQNAARSLAARTLERLCGYRVGVCPVTIEVDQGCGCAAPTSFYGGMYPANPVNWGGAWSNGACGCGSQCELRIPGPIGRLDALTVDGATVSVVDLEVVDHNVIAWRGTGDCPWTRTSKVRVTYVNAHLPGLDGILVCNVLTLEYAKALTGKQCRLPAGVTTVARQGVTMTIPSGAFPEGRTGIREVDAYTSLWNPHNIGPSAVWSPDTAHHRVVGG